MALIDLSARRIDLKFNRKDSCAFDLVIIDRETDDPIDFTGSTIALTVNTLADGTGTDLFTLAPINVLANDGLLRFKPSVANNDQAPGNYYHDIEWTFGSNIRTIVYGLWTIEPHITN